MHLWASPTHIVYDSIVTKFIMKTMSQSGEDLLKNEIKTCEEMPPNYRHNMHLVKSHLATAKSFLKMSKNSDLRNEALSDFPCEYFTYSKLEIENFVKTMCKKKIQCSNQIEGISADVVLVELSPLNLRLNNDEREIETTALNLLLKRGTRSFLYIVGESNSDCCICNNVSVQTAEHLIFQCTLVNEIDRIYLIRKLPSMNLRSIFTERDKDIFHSYGKVVSNIVNTWILSS